jgi:hypothetical protein
MVSALSLMVCAQWACVTTHKEMSPEQALTVATLPFSCLWWWPYRNNAEKEKTGPACSSYRKN